jgi:hypothetical protein
MTTAAINTFGTPRIDRLAADEAWHYRRDTPAYALRLDGRLSREAMQSRYILTAQRLAIALGTAAAWDDGERTLYADEKGVLREMEAAPC